MSTDPRKPGGPDETDAPIDGPDKKKPGTPEAGPVDPAIAEEMKRRQRRKFLKWTGVVAGGAALSLMPFGGGDRQPEPFQDVVGGTPPEGADQFRRHLRALEGMLSGEDESMEFLMPELQAEVQTYASLVHRINGIEAIMRNRIGGDRAAVREAVRTIETSNNVILRLMVEHLETNRRQEIASTTQPHNADVHRQLQIRMSNLVAMIKTEVNSLQSLVRHIETLAGLSRAIENVPQMADVKTEENDFLKGVYKRVNDQAQERMGPALSVLWGQMPTLGKMTQLRSFITAANMTLSDKRLREEARRTGRPLMPRLLTELQQLSDVELPHPDGIRGGDGQDDRMTTELQTEVGTALRNLQRNETEENVQAAIRALDRLRNAVIRQTDKVTNTRPAWIEVQTISLTGLALGGATTDYRAIVHLNQPPAGTKAIRGRLADITAIATRIERRRALHQEIRNLLRQRTGTSFEKKMQALQFAYRQEMNMELSDMLRRIASNAQGAENALMGDATVNYAGRAAETVHPDAALAGTPQQRDAIAAGQRGYSAMLEVRLMEHPEERRPLEDCVRAWRADAFNPGAPSFRALVAQLERMKIPVPRNPAENAYFTHWLPRLLNHAGVADLHLPGMSDEQIRVLATQQREYADSMVRHADAWKNITDPRKVTRQEVLEELMEMTFVGYRTQAIAEKAQKQQRNLPWLLSASYNTWGVSLFHDLTPSQVAYRLSGGRLGWDLRDIYKNGGSYWWLWTVTPPEYTASVLLEGETEADLNRVGVTRKEFEAMDEDGRAAALARIPNRKSQTVAEVKQAHAVKIHPLADGIKNATTTLISALNAGNIKNPSQLATERQFVATQGTDWPRELETIMRDWRERSGSLNGSMAPALVRARLGNNPFKRLQLLCEQNKLNLMDYKTVMRRPGGNWWGEGDNVDADKVVAALSGEDPPRVTDAELLWIYTKLLGSVPKVRGTTPELLGIMQRCSAHVAAEEQRLAGMARATHQERHTQLQRVYQARGALMAIYTQLSTQMQLCTDGMAFEQKDYMIDLARSLGLHLNVAATQYRLVDHDTAALPLMLIRAGELFLSYQLLIRLPGYLWHRWCESAKAKRFQAKLDALKAEHGAEMLALRDEFKAALAAKGEGMPQAVAKMLAKLKNVRDEIAKRQRLIERAEAAAAPAAEGTAPVVADAGVPAVEGAEAAPAEPATDAEPIPTAGELVIIRGELESLKAQLEVLLDLLADMPDVKDAEGKDDKEPPAAPAATA